MQASMQQSNIRQVLMKRIQMCEFALIEAGLFLDSHPDDQQALKYYSKHQQLLDQAKAEYVKQFGALEPTVMEGDTRWNWVDDPWPWDLEHGDRRKRLCGHIQKNWSIRLRLPIQMRLLQK